MLIPDWPQIEAFPTPLEPGERAVVEAYENLSGVVEQEMNIYVQPYLENYRPDVVVGIPGNGILIIEVKDWKPESKTRSRQARAAIQQAQYYRNILFSLCSSNIYSNITNAEFIKFQRVIIRLLYQSIGVAVAVPFLGYDERNSLFKGNLVHIIDFDSLQNHAKLVRPTQLPKTILPQELRNSVVESFWKSLNSWLTSPYHRAEQGSLSINHLTKRQQFHAVSRGAGWYRLRGPVGSGKSRILTHKAAFMAAEGKRVLVICFNITLTHYLRDLIAQHRYAFAWEQITIRHFHDLLKEIRLKFDRCFTPEEIESIPKDEFIDKFYPMVVAGILDDHPHHPYRYDAILIDEGQDFPVNWFQVLARCLKEDGELLIVRDRHQNVYCRDISWSDGDSQSIRGLKGLRGFRGKWAELKTTWRMSPTITRAVSEFAHRMLHSPAFNVDEKRIDQGELFQGSKFCRWENVQEYQLDSRLIQIVKEVTATMESTHSQMKPTHPSDIAILTYTNDLAYQVVDQVQKAGFPAVHVYDSDGKRDQYKIFRFRKGDGRIKVCTGHSFKGYELWGVILLVESRKNAIEQARWIYTAMGRAIEGLWVLNVDSNLNHVAEWFPMDVLE